MRLWKRRWFVLADYCLFYYKGELRLRLPRVPYAGEGGKGTQIMVFLDPVIGPIAYFLVKIVTLIHVDSWGLVFYWSWH